jgi:Plavaka transposase
MTKEETYHPFKSATDFKFAKRFWRRNLTMGTINDILQDESEDSDAGCWKDTLSFTNAKTWRQQIMRIPYGILDDSWQTRSFTINTLVADKQTNVYSFRYRNVLSVIDFLLGHQPFAPNLHYAPIRLLNKDNARVYNEMHTGDWWWETQKQLPEKATVVPLLLATDKTQLTHLHGDQSAWPVYLTIGNLDRQTRRAQKRPAVILLGLIPIPQSKSDARLKAEIYHTGMQTILQRTWKMDPAILLSVYFFWHS